MLTNTNVRLLVGLASSLTLLGLIVADAILSTYILAPSTIALLTALIWSFLGVDVFQQRGPHPQRRRRRRRDETTTDTHDTTDEKEP